MSRCHRSTRVIFITKVFCELVYTRLTFEYLITSLLSGYLYPLIVWNNEICHYLSYLQLFSIYRFVRYLCLYVYIYCFVHLISKVSFKLVVLSDQFKSFNYNLLTCLTTLKHSIYGLPGSIRVSVFLTGLSSYRQRASFDSQFPV